MPGCPHWRSEITAYYCGLLFGSHNCSAKSLIHGGLRKATFRKADLSDLGPHGGTRLVIFSENELDRESTDFNCLTAPPLSQPTLPALDLDLIRYIGHYICPYLYVHLQN
jgi:hypothetical protein